MGDKVLVVLLVECEVGCFVDDYCLVVGGFGIDCVGL